MPPPPLPADLDASALALLYAVRGAQPARALDLLQHAKTALSLEPPALFVAADAALAGAGEPLRLLHLAARADGGVSGAETEANVARTVALLLDHMPQNEVDRIDRAGLTPLHHACLAGRHHATTFLLERGADPDAVSTYPHDY